MIIGSKGPKVDVDEIRLLQKKKKTTTTTTNGCKWVTLLNNSSTLGYRIKIFTNYSKKEIELA